MVARGCGAVPHAEPRECGGRNESHPYSIRFGKGSIRCASVSIAFARVGLRLLLVEGVAALEAQRDLVRLPERS
jgi:hypothetical protein